MLDVSDEKKSILNKTELDEVDLAFDVSALRVLASRYLLKDAKGMIVGVFGKKSLLTIRS